jgi:hypothetical protein
MIVASSHGGRLEELATGSPETGKVKEGESLRLRGTLPLRRDSVNSQGRLNLVHRCFVRQVRKTSAHRDITSHGGLRITGQMWTLNDLVATHVFQPTHFICLSLAWRLADGKVITLSRRQPRQALLSS